MVKTKVVDDQTYIDKSVLCDIYQHAIENYPEECCGLIYGSELRKCRNIQNDLYAEDSKKYPRNARQGYTFSFEDMMFLNRNLDGENPVNIIYHSHPDVGAYFSREDYKRAVYEGNLIYPVDYLVIAVEKNNVSSSKLYRFKKNEFIEFMEYEGYQELMCEKINRKNQTNHNNAVSCIGVV